MTAPAYESLVIFLHGVNASGANLAPLGDALRPFLPRTGFAAPDAPNRSERRQSFQWFSVIGVSESNRRERVQAARAGFDRIVQAQIDSFGFAGQMERVALVGFSQGSIMALDALATGRWPVRAFVAFSGRLASPEPLAPRAGARALLIHGEADPVIPAQETRRAAQRLRDLGVDVEAHVFPRVGHSISPKGVALAGTFLAGSLV